MRGIVSVTGQTNTVSGKVKLEGKVITGSSNYLSIFPFFTQQERVSSIITVNGSDVSDKITSFDLNLTTNQVGMCTLNTKQASMFKVNDVIDVRFLLPDYGNVRIFYGYVDKIEKNQLDRGQIICTDKLRELRDGVITQIIAEFEEVRYTGSIGARFVSRDIFKYILNDGYTLQCTVQPIGREVSLGSANKLSVLQDLCDEMCLIFGVDYNTNTIFVRNAETSNSVDLPLTHNLTITERGKPNTGVLVTYQNDYCKAPVTKSFHSEYYDGERKVEAQQIYYGDVLLYDGEVDYLGHFRDMNGRAANYYYRPKDRYAYILVNVWDASFDFSGVGVSAGTFGAIVKPLGKPSFESEEYFYVDSQWRIYRHTAYSRDNIALKNYGVYPTNVWTERIVENYTKHGNGFVRSYNKWQMDWDNYRLKLVDSSNEWADSRPAFSFPTSELCSDVKSVIVGSDENPINYHTSYISRQSEAKALAEWKVKTELQSKDIEIEIRKIIPGLKPGSYCTYKGFDGRCFIDSVRYSYNVQSRSCNTVISGVLID